jgi:hypothetical protein
MFHEEVNINVHATTQIIHMIETCVLLLSFLLSSIVFVLSANMMAMNWASTHFLDKSIYMSMGIYIYIRASVGILYIYMIYVYTYIQYYDD